MHGKTMETATPEELQRKELAPEKLRRIVQAFDRDGFVSSLSDCSDPPPPSARASARGPL